MTKLQSSLDKSWGQRQDVAGMGVEMLAAGQAVGPPSVVAEPAVLDPTEHHSGKTLVG